MTSRTARGFRLGARFPRQLDGSGGPVRARSPARLGAAYLA
ncbi:hypothetical protein [Jiangella sp. DSM 45060]|nr:hypothetical protein [Jiangella sp. DSM 45060]